MTAVRVEGTAPLDMRDVFASSDPIPVAQVLGAGPTAYHILLANGYRVLFTSSTGSLTYTVAGGNQKPASGSTFDRLTVSHLTSGGTVDALVDFRLTEPGTASDINYDGTSITSATLVNAFSVWAVEPFRWTTDAKPHILVGSYRSDWYDLNDAAITVYDSGGNDTYLNFGPDDHIFEPSGVNSGIDKIETYLVSIDLADFPNIEHVTLRGEANLNVWGSEVFNYIQGNTGNNIIDGRQGDDHLFGGSGNDVLIGGEGVDKLEGGTGDDTYYVDDLGDTIVEDSYGTDTIVSSTISLDLNRYPSADLENATLLGNLDLNITANNNKYRPGVFIGNSGNNRIQGHASIGDTFDGGAGNDTLIGGTGNDTYVMGLGTDTIIDAGGIDTVRFSVSQFSIANYRSIENLVLTGNAVTGTGNSLGNRITGNDRPNRLYGLDGNDILFGGGGNDILDAGSNHSSDVLNGGAGADTMIGGYGNDTYYVDAGDKIVEAAYHGEDTVISSISWTLQLYLENLTLTGSAAVNGTGNKHDNKIIGNDRANHLYGMDGNDKLYGRGGNDVLDAGKAHSNDILDGGAGADRLIGGYGDDIYYTDLKDKVIEAAKHGNDTVITAVSWRLEKYVENLKLIGSASVNGTGNSIDNKITGNAAANQLYGNGGNDTLSGGGGRDGLSGGAGKDKLKGGADGDFLQGNAGNDVLTGGGGGDSFYFDMKAASNGVDHITDFTSGSDFIVLKASMSGFLASNALVAGTTPKDANDRIMYNRHTGDVYFDPDGTGSHATVRFAILDHKPAVTAHDFYFIT